MTSFDEWFECVESPPGLIIERHGARFVWLAALREAAKLACNDCRRGHMPMLRGDGYYYHGPELECASGNIHREIALMEKA